MRNGKHALEKRQGHTEMPHGPCMQAAGEQSGAGPGATGVRDVPGMGLEVGIYWASSGACHAWVGPETSDCPIGALLHLAASSPADGVVPGGVLPQTGHSMHYFHTGFITWGCPQASGRKHSPECASTEEEGSFSGNQIDARCKKLRGADLQPLSRSRS